MEENLQNSEQLYNLISKNLEGNISLSEKEELSALLKNSEENKIIYEQTKKLWETPIAPHFEVNTTAAWDKLNARIQDEKVIPLEPKSNIKIWLSIAATLVIGLSIFGVFKMQKDDLLSLSTQLGEVKTIALSDNTSIDLNENSTITYPKLFDKNTREVNLKGEAFFDVARDESKPFIIHTKNTDVRVLGTSFIIKETDNETTEVLVKTGVVKVQSIVDTSINLTIVKGESLVFNAMQNKMLKKEANKNSFFWQNKTLFFNKTDLNEVVRVLNEMYDVDIQIEDEIIKNCRLSVTFKKLGIEEVLTIISTTLNIKSEKKNNTYFLTGDGC